MFMNIKVTTGQKYITEMDAQTQLNHHIYQRGSDSYPNSSGYDVRKIITIQYVVHVPMRGLRELLGAAVLQKPVWRAVSGLKCQNVSMFYGQS